jgi:hypothetical protein
MPVLVLGGDIYPGLGGDFPGNFALSSTQALAANVTGITVPLSGHYIPEEQPQFVIEQLASSLENNIRTNSWSISQKMKQTPRPLILHCSTWFIFSKVAV